MDYLDFDGQPDDAYTLESGAQPGFVNRLAGRMAPEPDAHSYYVRLAAAPTDSSELIHLCYIRTIRLLLRAQYRSEKALNPHDFRKQLRNVGIAYNILFDPPTRMDYDLRLLGLREPLNGQRMVVPEEARSGTGKTRISLLEVLILSRTFGTDSLLNVMNAVRILPEEEVWDYFAGTGAFSPSELDGLRAGVRLLRHGVISLVQFEQVFQSVRSSGYALEDILIHAGWADNERLASADRAADEGSEPSFHFVEVQVDKSNNRLTPPEGIKVGGNLPSWASQMDWGEDIDTGEGRAPVDNTGRILEYLSSEPAAPATDATPASFDPAAGAETPNYILDFAAEEGSTQEASPAAPYYSEYAASNQQPQYIVDFETPEQPSVSPQYSLDFDAPQPDFEHPVPGQQPAIEYGYEPSSPWHEAPQHTNAPQYEVDFDSRDISQPPQATPVSSWEAAVASALAGDSSAPVDSQLKSNVPIDQISERDEVVRASPPLPKGSWAAAVGNILEGGNPSQESLQGSELTDLTSAASAFLQGQSSGYFPSLSSGQLPPFMNQGNEPDTTGDTTPAPPEPYSHYQHSGGAPEPTTAPPPGLPSYLVDDIFSEAEDTPITREVGLHVPQDLVSESPGAEPIDNSTIPADFARTDAEMPSEQNPYIDTESWLPEQPVSETSEQASSLPDEGALYDFAPTKPEQVSVETEVDEPYNVELPAHGTGVPIDSSPLTSELVAEALATSVDHAAPALEQEQEDFATLFPHVEYSLEELQRLAQRPVSSDSPLSNNSILVDEAVFLLDEPITGETAVFTQSVTPDTAGSSATPAHLYPEPAASTFESAHLLSVEPVTNPSDLHLSSEPAVSSSDSVSSDSAFLSSEPAVSSSDSAFSDSALLSSEPAVSSSDSASSDSALLSSEPAVSSSDSASSDSALLSSEPAAPLQLSAEPPPASEPSSLHTSGDFLDELFEDPLAESIPIDKQPLQQPPQRDFLDELFSEAEVAEQQEPTVLDFSQNREELQPSPFATKGNLTDFVADRPANYDGIPEPTIRPITPKTAPAPQEPSAFGLNLFDAFDHFKPLEEDTSVTAETVSETGEELDSAEPVISRESDETIPALEIAFLPQATTQAASAAATELDQIAAPPAQVLQVQPESEAKDEETNPGVDSLFVRGDDLQNTSSAPAAPGEHLAEASEPTPLAETIESSHESIMPPPEVGSFVSAPGDIGGRESEPTVVANVEPGEQVVSETRSTESVLEAEPPQSFEESEVTSFEPGLLAQVDPTTPAHAQHSPEASLFVVEDGPPVLHVLEQPTTADIDTPAGDSAHDSPGIISQDELPVEELSNEDLVEKAGIIEHDRQESFASVDLASEATNYGGDLNVSPLDEAARIVPNQPQPEIAESSSRNLSGAELHMPTAEFRLPSRQARAEAASAGGNERTDASPDKEPTPYFETPTAPTAFETPLSFAPPTTDLQFAPTIVEIEELAPRKDVPARWGDFRLWFGGNEKMLPSSGNIAKIGRNRQTCDVAIQEPAVSREHCLLELRTDGVYLKDLGSRHGTFIVRGVHELTATSAEPIKLENGDFIRLGKPGAPALEWVWIRRADKRTNLEPADSTYVVTPDQTSGEPKAPNSVPQATIDQSEDMEEKKRSRIPKAALEDGTTPLVNEEEEEESREPKGAAIQAAAAAMALSSGLGQESIDAIMAAMLNAPSTTPAPAPTPAQNVVKPAPAAPPKTADATKDLEAAVALAVASGLGADAIEAILAAIQKNPAQQSLPTTSAPATSHTTATSQTTATSEPLAASQPSLAASEPLSAGQPPLAASEPLAASQPEPSSTSEPPTANQPSHTAIDFSHVVSSETGSVLPSPPVKAAQESSAASLAPLETAPAPVSVPAPPPPPRSTITCRNQYQPFFLLSHLARMAMAVTILQHHR